MAKTLPPRSKVKSADQWDLASLFPSDAAWEKVFAGWEKLVPGYAKFKGKLASSPRTIAALLAFDADVDRAGERLGSYAFLKSTEDQGDSRYQRMKGRFQHAAAKAAEAASWIRPELMSIPKAKMDKFLKAKELAPWKLALERVLRFRPHTLTPHEEQILAMQGPMSTAAGQIFRQLNEADLKFGMLKDEKNELVELGHSSFSAFLHSPKRSIREAAFRQYYAQFDAHRNTIAASLNGSNQRDAYYAKVRNFSSARAASLFEDNVPVAVYDNLIDTIHQHLPTVHRYLDVRRRALKLKDLHMFDTYVPIVSGIEKHHTWDQAVTAVVDALQPLGSEYCTPLADGLNSGRWCDRYPNAGKQSGAFSAGGYDGKPYILMNYLPAVLDHVFTLAHEAGHSMHTYFSARNQPYQYYGYTIFVAEVASTFNEQLLLKYMLDRATNRKERAYLISHAIDEIRGTIVRQTMFAEFEKITHDLVEKGEPLTVDALRGEYRQLLERYFGKRFVIDQELDLECLRIPHFYRGFYVYKYATGLSAAIALSQRVLHGGAAELDAYLGFLKGGCSKWPLDLLRDAGVDMTTPAPINSAMTHFADLVDELEELL